MQLSYRGIKYNKNSIGVASEGKTFTAKYRGVNYHTFAGKSIVKPSSYSLKYRGITYESNPIDNFHEINNNNPLVDSQISQDQLMA